MQHSTKARKYKAALDTSLSETWAFFRRTQPDQLEEALLQKAIHASLLDFAVTLHKLSHSVEMKTQHDPAETLGVSHDASASVIRAAYRKKALKAHPDRGGDAEAFVLLQRSYHILLAKVEAQSDVPEKSADAPTSAKKPRLDRGKDPLLAIVGVEKQVEKIDMDLHDHRQLVESWFERHGVDVGGRVTALEAAIDSLDLEAREMGATNRNEQGVLMYNQCFYLSLARAYLSADDEGGEPARELLEETALHLKRVIETAVLRAHPEWAGRQVGEDLQAFSDFLFYVMSSNALLSELAVAIVDSSSGAVEVYRGMSYPAEASPHADDQLRANLLVIKFLAQDGGHYQALVPKRSNFKRTGSSRERRQVLGRGPTLKELLERLDLYQVRYVLTDG